jgi:hypothetical protein
LVQLIVSTEFSTLSIDRAESVALRRWSENVFAHSSSCIT